MLLCTAIFLTGCSSTAHPIISTHQSANQSSRIAFLILHYTNADEARSLERLTAAEYNVSAHYLIPRESPQPSLPIYQLVADDQRAWHAGRSRWKRNEGINASSLGIEIVNLSYPPEDEVLAPHLRRWQPYTQEQISAIGHLSQQLVSRYDIPPTHILGHSDIAPQRKQDPGPHFPWRTLHLQYGVGAWPDEAYVTTLLTSDLPVWEVTMWQQQLAHYGYNIPQSGQWDEPSQAVLRAFQLHFRPTKVDSKPDRESQAILMALIAKYLPPIS